MVEFDPGDPQGGKRTSTAHHQHDPSKATGLDGHSGTNLKETGAKLIKNDKNREIDGDAEDKEEDRKMTKEELEQTKAEDADSAMAMAMAMARAMAIETELDNNNEPEDNMTAKQLQISILENRKKNHNRGKCNVRKMAERGAR